MNEHIDLTALSNESKEYKMGGASNVNKDSSTNQNTLFLGIDLGTYKTSISSSSGVKKSIRTLVGRPKDAISMKLLKDPIIFGEDVLKKRLALDIFNPMEDGVIKKDSEQNIFAAEKMFKHLIEPIKNSGGFEKTLGIICVPSKATLVTKQTIIDILSPMLNGVMIVSTPFAVAYGIGAIEHSIIIDMGAGTVNICRVHGSIPDDDDQATIYKGGNFIDRYILNMLEGKYTDANINLYMVQKFKEAAGAVKDGKLEVEISFEGKKETKDIFSDLKKACEAIIPDIKSTVHELIISYDPDFQKRLVNNIIITGGLSKIGCLTDSMEAALKDIGCSKPKIIDDITYAASYGALKLGEDMPEIYWQQLGY